MAGGTTGILCVLPIMHVHGKMHGILGSTANILINAEMPCIEMSCPKNEKTAWKQAVFEWRIGNSNP